MRGEGRRGLGREGKKSRRLSILRAHTRGQHLYVVTEAMRMSHDSLAVRCQSAGQENTEVLMAFG